MNVRLAALALLLAPTALPAHAEDGAWRVGPSYVIRFDYLDLTQPADRQALLGQVERSSRKLCEGQHTKARREACQVQAQAQSLSRVPHSVRTAVETARLERDRRMQAQN